MNPLRAVEDKDISAGHDPALEANAAEKIVTPKLILDVIMTRGRQTPPPAAQPPEVKPHETPL